MYCIPKLLRSEIADSFVQWCVDVLVVGGVYLRGMVRNWVAHLIQGRLHPWEAVAVPSSLLERNNDVSFGAVDRGVPEYFLINMRIAAAASICGHILPRYGLVSK